jgi:hypothetical protein
MILRLIVCISMCLFSIWQGFVAASVPTETGSHYFPGEYIFVVVLLASGLNKFGLMTWPIATVILLLKGHLIVGWVPLFLVILNVVGNKYFKNQKVT